MKSYLLTIKTMIRLCPTLHGTSVCYVLECAMTGKCISIYRENSKERPHVYLTG